jgi:hypothetical protein
MGQRRIRSFDRERRRVVWEKTTMWDSLKIFKMRSCSTIYQRIKARRDRRYITWKTMRPFKLYRGGYRFKVWRSIWRMTSQWVY